MTQPHRVPPARVVVIGAGAAGVFTAYRLKQRHGDACEVVLIERSGRVGGNAQSIALEFGGRQYSIDLGAQFFHANPQPSYVRLLDELGLFQDPAQIQARATGITLWDRQRHARLLWLPSHLDGFLRYRAADWSRLIGFATFLVHALLLDRDESVGWTLGVDDWVGRLSLIDPVLRDRILRPFLYQFVTMPRGRLGEASAKYAIAYFVRNVFGEGGIAEPDPAIETPDGGETFQVYQSLIGLDGVLNAALTAAGVVPRLNEPVTAVRLSAAGGLEVSTATDTIPADHVVFATDPQSAAAMLTAGAFPAAPVIPALQQCEYGDLTISMQSGGSCWMPEDPRYRETVNTIVDGEGLAFTAWFGPLRDPVDGGGMIPVFKSWASPNLDAAGCSHTFLTHQHRILVPTTSFMAQRAVVQAHQGQQGVWFAGGWTNWFDSQEAALDSATAIVDRLSGDESAATAARADGTADRDRQRTRIARWIERVARHAPADVRAALLARRHDVDTM